MVHLRAWRSTVLERTSCTTIRVTCVTVTVVNNTTWKKVCGYAYSIYHRDIKSVQLLHRFMLARKKDVQHLHKFLQKLCAVI